MTYTSGAALSKWADPGCALQDAAGQLTRSPFRFNSIGSQSPLLWLSRKFAVLDGPTMPIIAEGDEEPNDTYVQQLTDSARAAIEVHPWLPPALRACRPFMSSIRRS